MAGGQAASHSERGIRRLLSLPAAYDLAQNALGARRARRRVFEAVVKPRAGERVLDLGCGTGGLLDELPQVDYLGIDINRHYVEAAQRRHGDRGRFVCGDVRSDDVAGGEQFDLVLLFALLHHLDDDEARALLAAAAARLAPGGRLVALDNARVTDQRLIARWLMNRDRGLSIRRPEEYAELARTAFASVELTVYHDLARLPYDHVVMRCAN